MQVGGVLAGLLYMAIEEMQFPGGGPKGGGLFVGWAAGHCATILVIVPSSEMLNWHLTRVCQCWEEEPGKHCVRLVTARRVPACGPVVTRLGTADAGPESELFLRGVGSALGSVACMVIEAGFDFSSDVLLVCDVWW